MTDERRRDRMRSFMHDFPPNKIWEANTITKGEMTMSERLTRDWIERDFKIHKDQTGGAEAFSKCLFDAIESDRDATRAEVMKDHFKIGEMVQVKTLWGKGGCRVAIVREDDNAPLGITSVSFDPNNWRRPPKTLTTEQKIHAIKSYLQTTTMTIWDKIDETTLDALMKAANLPTEVEE